jgi:7,8-dihydropterin-6-yl-methyl-4-(beta-D-ribofuranosyl)aminobenzene 5'-phosphate synthase
MVVDSDGIAAAISGCAHPGMERVIDRAKNLLSKEVERGIGGCHLMYADAAAIAALIRALHSLGVEQGAILVKASSALARGRHAP